MRLEIGIALGYVLLTANASWAQTINILVASIQSGQVHVEGSQAPKKTPIFWEGVSVGTSTTNGGAFSFNVTNLPSDCVGLLTIGSASRNVVISGCTIISTQAGIPKTGQTISYEPGDDGDLERGVALPSPRFTDNLNGTITDNLTGLIWLKNANCDGSVHSFSGAFAYISSLNSIGSMNGNDCGDVSNNGSHQTDWRLPNVRELLSLINNAYAGPALSNAAGTGPAVNGDPFLNIIPTEDFIYWTSTSYLDATQVEHLRVGFFFGSICNPCSSPYQDFVLPVRGGL